MRHSGDGRAAAVLDVGRRPGDRAGRGHAAEGPEAMLAKPWATSSTLDLCRLPSMPSATTADSSDSMAARSATVRAGEKSSRIRGERDLGQLRRRNTRRGSRRIATRSSRRESRTPRPRPSRPGSPRSEPGTRRESLGQRTRMASDPAATPIAAGDGGAEAPSVGLPLRQEVGGHGAHPEPEEVLDLGGEDDHGDPAREPGDDRVRNELDRAAEPREPHGHEQDSRQDRADRQAVEAVFFDDAVDDHDESAGGAPDLDTAPAEEGDQEPGHDGRDQSLLGRDSGGDREGEGQRDRHDPDDDAGLQIGSQLAARVTPKGRERLGQPRRLHGAILRAIRSGGYPAGCCC